MIRSMKARKGTARRAVPFHRVHPNRRNPSGLTPLPPFGRQFGRAITKIFQSYQYAVLVDFRIEKVYNDVV